MRRVLKNCYDSHVHWLATGEQSQRLVLNHLKNPNELAQLEIKKHHFRGSWLVGWGWDQNNWNPPEFPHLTQLNKLYPDFPVAFSRADGHALWVNSVALSKLSLDSLNQFDEKNNAGRVIRDSNQKPTGILIDHAMSLVNSLLPQPTSTEVREFLIEGMRLFNKQGFTHIRDLSCSEEQWNQSVILDQRGELTLAVEQFFDADPVNHFDRALELAKRARREPTKLLRVKGIKVYYDGALGSEGALLSHSYRSGEKGLRLMTIEQFKDVAIRTWSENFDLAIHVIGDQAAHEVAVAARDLWESGQQGRLHLEHAEMMRPETIQYLKGRDVICHMQPCHWLTDRKWLHHKVQDLTKYVFPWAMLEKENIRFDFGSDSPIEYPRLSATIESLRDSEAQGVPRLRADPLSFHEHPDHDWTPNTFTEVAGIDPVSVQFLGKPLNL